MEGGRTGYTPDDVMRVATNFDWDISQGDAETGVSLLGKLRLVNVS